MQNDDLDQLQLVQAYRQLVERYEALDRRIDDLIMRHGGVSENMPDTDLEQYRQLARQRTELLNQMRRAEQELNIGADFDSQG